MSRIWIEEGEQLENRSRQRGGEDHRQVPHYSASGRIEDLVTQPPQRDRSNKSATTAETGSSPESNFKQAVSQSQAEASRNVIPSGSNSQEEQFQARISKMAPSLTPTEIIVCSLVRRNASTKEIAAQLGTSVHTVFTHRKNLRRKLGMNEKESLYSVLIRL